MSGRRRVGFTVACAVALIIRAYAASTWNVKSDGTGDFQTLAQCQTGATSGDTCKVFNLGNAYAGLTFSKSGISYIGVSTPVINSTVAVGASTNITFGGLTSADGFELTGTGANFTFGNASQIIIQNVSVHDTGSGNRCLQMATNGSATFIYLLHDHFYNCGALGTSGLAQGGQMSGDHWLIDGSHIEHVEDGFAYYVSDSIIRNTEFGPLAFTDYGSNAGIHPDMVETVPSTGDHAGSHNVFETIWGHDWRGPNAHFSHMTDNSSVGNTGAIFRFIALSTFGSASWDMSANVANQYAYNNSATEFNLEANNGVSDATWVPTSPNNHVKNNIMADNWGGTVTTPPHCFQYTTGGTEDNDYNLCDDARDAFSGAWASPGGSYGAHTIFNQVPKFVNAASNLRLQSGSPAIGAGGPLTTVGASDTGSGTSLVLSDAGYFQDGKGLTGVVGDCLRVGTTNTTCITSLNYATNTATISPALSRSVGDPVYIYRLSDGTVVLNGPAPDLGAFPFSSGSGSLGSLTLSAIKKRVRRD